MQLIIIIKKHNQLYTRKTDNWSDYSGRAIIGIYRGINSMIICQRDSDRASAKVPRHLEDSGGRFYNGEKKVRALFLSDMGATMNVLLFWGLNGVVLFWLARRQVSTGVCPPLPSD